MSWWTRLWRRGRMERQLESELQFHLERQVVDNQAAGMNAGEARRQARISFGGLERFREECRDARGTAWVEALFQDLRFGFRLLRRSPGFAIVAVLTLALGIGAATAMFSVVNAVLIETSPYPDSARLVQVLGLARLNGRPAQFDNVPVEAFEAVQASGEFKRVGLAGYTDRTLYRNGVAEGTRLYLASPDLFATLGVVPELGRGFAGGGHEIVLSDEVWRQRFHSDSGVLGSSVRVDDQVYTVVGVLHPGQAYPPGAKAWLPGLPAPGETGLLVTRLQSGLAAAPGLQQARVAVATIGRRLTLRGLNGLAAAPLRRQIAGGVARSAILMLFAAVLFVLLIACANTAQLLLARGFGRQREFAARRALGASRARLFRQLLTESAWLAAGGGVLGWALAVAAMRLVRLGPASIPRLQSAHLDLAVLGFAAVIAVLSGLACGLAPALRFSNPNLQGGLQEGGPLTGRVRGAHTLLLVGEIALTLVLLVGAGLMLRSFGRLLAVDPGFNPHQVLAFDVAMPRQPYTTSASQTIVWQHRARLEQAALARLRALPGVVAATFGDDLPLGGASGAAFRHLEDPPTGFINADFLWIGPGYFQMLGVSLIRGRDFTAADLTPPTASPRPILINRTMAEEFWPARDPIGQQLITTLPPKPNLVVVVGVVGDMRDTALASPPRPQAYFPMQGNRSSPTFLVRSALPPGALIPAARGALAASGFAMGEPTTLDQALADSLAEPHFRTLLLAAFASLALALALIGLYGALAYHVRRRTREIGVRMVLGAGSGAMQRMILGQSLRVLATGIGVGWLLAWYLTRYVASLLFGVSALDAATWIGATAALVTAGLLASYLPARRAATVDPVLALRCE